MIFVTGGTGFLGRHLVPTLCRAGYPLRVLTRSPQDNMWLQNYPEVEVVTGDLVTGAGLSAIQGCTHVIHAAGLFSMWRHAGDFDATNVSGTRFLLEMAIEAKIQRLIYVSTIAVIGKPQLNCIIDESHPPRPTDPYQASKLKAELLVKRYFQTHGLNAVILRAGAYYGPLGNYAFNRLFFTDPMRGIIMQMDGGRYQIFPVYIADVAQAIVNALHLGRAGEIYNISGENLSHKEAFDHICAAGSIRWPRLSLPGFLGISTSRILNLLSRVTGQEPFWPLGLRSYVFNDWRVSIEKARSELDFVPTNFRSGVEKTIEWYQAGRPDWFADLECNREEN